MEKEGSPDILSYWSIFCGCWLLSTMRKSVTAYTGDSFHHSLTIWNTDKFIASYDFYYLLLLPRTVWLFFFGLLVCQQVFTRTTGWAHSPETRMEDGSQPWIDPIHFWCRSGQSERFLSLSLKVRYVPIFGPRHSKNVPKSSTKCEEVTVLTLYQRLCIAMKRHLLTLVC